MAAKYVLIISFLLATVLAEIYLSPDQVKEARNALENPNLFEGDIAGPIDTDRSATTGERYRWPQATIPYIIDSSLNKGKARNVIQQAMNEYHRRTCIRFVPRKKEKNYIKIFSGNGCYSHVGRTGGQQPVSLGKGCLYIGIVIHELGHAVGFFHEQSRSDRDEYLIIYLENVDQSMKGNFFKLKPHENILYNTFDYDSIMIYGSKSFSMNGRDTMVARNGHKLVDAFYKSKMTSSDEYRMRKMYNC
ncbi:astacin-like metalloprotease toxin 5 [Parasteatoda tepidariorum]|uniref:astacin-like metalloprotease toxin 5 n=1 Tax=Parasteatoda tepidariorum TaxID=114398 RepID=UPI001C721F7B|nr:astacin-like metalloprotease toxin 5 [Parasteatoda tepidariorum]